MDSSKRAVESYWRSRLIDAVTSDEDKVAPVYKLEEICELLRSSHAGVVREVSGFIFKRTDHKSPIVKQKALRLIKYAVGKSGVEFRREMQRNSAVVRQLLHYKGQLDPLKADALNKAVRDTAQEAVSAIFSVEENKTAPSDNLAKRIQGFGNTNFEMQSDDKKSFLSEVVGIGSASIKQGLSSFTQAHSARKNGNGSYKGPNLRRSLTTEIDYPDGYVGVEHPSNNQGDFGISKNNSGGPWVQPDLRASKTEPGSADSCLSHTDSKTHEERLLETIVTSGGVRLQPTRDAIQTFLAAAGKMNALPLCHAIEMKLQSHLWQVRMKAICVLESILRKKDEEKFTIVASYFYENKDVVVNCSESPQASLREKANKVLGLLGGENTSSVSIHADKPVEAKASNLVQMPNLIDTADSDDYHGAENSSMETASDVTASSPSVIDDLFGNSLSSRGGTSEQKIDDDPFADVSFHASSDAVKTTAIKDGTDPFGIFAENHDDPKSVSDMMADLSVKENSLKSSGLVSDTVFSDLIVQNDPENVGMGSQAAVPSPNLPFPSGSMADSMNPPVMFNPASLSHPMNYGAIGSLFTQQQLLAAMHNFQHLGNLSSQGGGGASGGSSLPVPDIFHPNVMTQNVSTVTSNPKKEETKAFDFISDHIAAARDPKRVV